MKYSRLFRGLLLAAILIQLTSCGSRAVQTPGTEFATYVKAFTGGRISDGSAIQVRLGVMPDQSVDPTSLFSFSPSLKGSARYSGSDIVEFVPEAGALKPGQAYKCSFDLGKALGLKEKELQKFPFGFQIAQKEASIESDGVYFNRDEPLNAYVSGYIRSSEHLGEDQVREMFSAPKDVEEPYFELTEVDASTWAFATGPYTRQAKDRTVKVSLKDAGTGFKTGGDVVFNIAGTESPFDVTEAILTPGKSPNVTVYFTQPLENMNLSGIFSLYGGGRYNISLGSNFIRADFERLSDEGVTVEIGEGLKQRGGQRFGKTFSRKFEAGEAVPAVEFPFEGNILPDTKDVVIPFRAVNLSAVDLRIIKIYEDNVLGFLQDNTLSGQSDLRRSGRLVYSKQIRLDDDPERDLHRWNDYSVNLSGLFRKEPGAIYRIRITFCKEYSLYGKQFASASNGLVELASSGLTAEDEAVWDTPDPWYYDNFANWDEYEWQDRDNPLTPSFYMDSDRFPVVNLLASDLGVIAKYADGDQIWTAVTDLNTAAPAKGADVQVYNYQLRQIGKAKTDGEGLAEIPVSGRPFAVVARKGNSTSYLKVQDGLEKSLSRFDVGGRRLEKGLKAFIYGERGVWRPGDTLHVTAILQDKGERLPDNHPAALEIYTPQGQFYGKQVCGSSTDGFYTFNVVTKSDDPTGVWNAYLKVGGASFHKSLRIETVKPNRLKIDLQLGDKVLRAGNRTRIDLGAKWLTGPAAAGLGAKAVLNLGRGTTRIPGFEKYTFNNPTTTFSGSETKIVDTRLDGNGSSSTSVLLPSASDAPGMLSATLVTTVEEPGGDVSFTTTTVPFSPFSAYVGIQSPAEQDKDLETDKANVFRIAVVDPDGNRVSGHNLEYRIYKLSWSWWWESRAEELASYVNSSDAQICASGKLVSAASDNTVSFQVDYPEWGRYLLLVKDRTGGHVSGQTFVVDWPAYRGRADRRDPSALTMLTFSTDEKSYQAGEAVTVYIPAAEGRALVSIENAAGVLSQKWVTTSTASDTQYKFKVTPEMAPNFYIHITLVQPHKNTAEGQPIRMYGVQPVLVNDPASRLEPVISMADAVHPEETFAVKVSEKSGKTMTYTLALVDEGLLDITGFKTPDPWNAMYAREALSVRTWDLYDAVIGAFGGHFPTMLQVGGDEDVMVGNRKDNRFNPVVKVLGPFTLKSGSQTHKITLPMYVGSIRVMVVAGHDGAFGNAEKAVAVRNPLMVLPTLPRVLGTNEIVSLPVNVFALEEAVKQADVKVSVEGPVKIAGADSRSVSFAKPGDELVSFQLETTGEEGIARVTVSAGGSGHKASETISIAVRNPNPVSIAMQRQLIDAGGAAEFGYQPFVADDKSYASLTLSSFPAIDFNANFAWFGDYVYSCTEQLSARGLNLIYTRELLSDENKAKADEAIEGILSAIYTRQLPDGGFAYWPGMTVASTWVSSMAGQFLTEASGKGVKVGKQVLSAWQKFQANASQNYRKSNQQGLYDLDQAYRLYTLALAGKTDAAAMNRLKETDGLSYQARLMLASAYALSGKKAIAKEMIGEKQRIEAYSDAVTFGSSLRDQAIALETQVLVDDIAGAMETAQEVADAFGRGYASTQERAFASVAMSRLAAKVGTGNISAEVDGKQFKSKLTSGSMAIRPEAGSVNVKNTSEGTLYATLVTASPVPVASAQANGLRLKVSYTGENGAVLNPAALRQGTDFTATVTVTNTSLGKDYTNLALMEMIPSGWEIVNERLLGTVSSQNSYDYQDIRDDRSIWYFSLPLGTSKTFKLRLRAAYEGTFSLPAVTCEAMYDARINACTASGTAVVSK